MKNLVYQVFVDVWRIAYKYRFQRLDESQWLNFIADAEKLMDRYKDTAIENLFRLLIQAIQAFYEQL